MTSNALHETQEISKAFQEIETFILTKKGEGLKTHLRHHINHFIKKNQKFAKRVEEVFEKQPDQFLKNKDVRGIVKLIEKELHTTYSQFLSTNKAKRENALEKAESISELLDFHKSTKERIETYDEVYQKITQFIQSKDSTIKKISILDIACGMNPLSIEKMNKHVSVSNWMGCDVNASDMEYLQKAYDRFKFKGEFFSFDVTLEESLINLESKEVDILFAFKALDSFEYFKRNISFDILKRLNYRFGIISFATFSLGGRKKIPITKRAWLFKFFEREGIKYELYETDNEVYIMFERSDTELL